MWSDHCDWKSGGKLSSWSLGYVTKGGSCLEGFTCDLHLPNVSHDTMWEAGSSYRFLMYQTSIWKKKNAFIHVMLTIVYCTAWQIELHMDALHIIIVKLLHHHKINLQAPNYCYNNCMHAGYKQTPATSRDFKIIWHACVQSQRSFITEDDTSQNHFDHHGMDTFHVLTHALPIEGPQDHAAHSMQVTSQADLCPLHLPLNPLTSDPESYPWALQCPPPFINEFHSF